MTKIKVLDRDVTVIAVREEDYICLINIARYKDPKRTDYIIFNWMGNRNTIEFLGLWEQLNNPSFNPIEFDGIKNQAGLNMALFGKTAMQWRTENPKLKENIRDEANVSKAIPEIMFYQVLSPEFKDQLDSLASGTTVPIVNKSKFNSIDIVLPPLPEQRRIVGILDEAFEGLATAKANAEKTLQNARALFESHLNAFDDFNVKHYKGKFNAFQRTYVITVNEKNRVRYRFLYFQLLKSLAKFKSQSVGAGTNFLKLGMIKNMEIALPKIAEQEQIVAKVDSIREASECLEWIYHRKIAVLDELKKSMLHRAFSGQL